MCRKKYHLIIPSQRTVHTTHHLCSAVEASLGGRHGAPFNPLSNVEEEDDEEEEEDGEGDVDEDNSTASYVAPTSIYDSTKHHLHGVLHLNGFGHLLRMNKGDSAFQQHSGTHLMTIWDGLCSLLGTREVRRDVIRL